MLADRRFRHKCRNYVKAKRKVIQVFVNKIESAGRQENIQKDGKK